MRPEIAEERKGDPFKALGPGLQTRNMIDAYTQNLGIETFERSQLKLVRRYLIRSDWRPRPWEESNHDIVSPAILAESDGVSLVALQLKVWSLHPY